jgi:hypothetical protein
MGNRVALVSMALLAACGSKKADGPAGGSAVGSAAAVAGGSGGDGSGGSAGSAAGGSGGGAPRAHCIPSDAEHVLSTFVADDKAATFCLKKETDEKGASTCTTVDLATGAYRPAAALPARPPAPAAALTIKQDAQGVEACKAGACQKLELPAPKVEDGSVSEYRVVVSEDGKRLVATGDALEGVVFLDGVTGKKLRSVKIASTDSCIDDAYFLGESVYVATSNCAGPGGSAVLYSFAGKKLGDVGSQGFNTFGAEPLQVAGDQWVVAGYGGGGVLVFDARTGKALHQVEVKPPADCDRCDEVLGTAAHWSASPLVKLPAGKLATIDGTGVTIIDPATGKIEKTHRMPICPAKP